MFVRKLGDIEEGKKVRLKDIAKWRSGDIGRVIHITAERKPTARFNVQPSVRISFPDGSYGTFFASEVSGLGDYGFGKRYDDDGAFVGRLVASEDGELLIRPCGVRAYGRFGQGDERGWR